MSENKVGLGKKGKEIKIKKKRKKEERSEGGGNLLLPSFLPSCDATLKT